MDFQIESKQASENWQVSLQGEIDIFNSPELKKSLNELITKEKLDIYVDCKNLEYIDSTGLGALVGVLKNVKSHGKEIYLSNVKPSILKLFRITNLDKVFIMEATTVEEGKND